MSDLPIPTRAEVTQLLQAVLDGTTTRTAAAEWATEVQEMIEEQDSEPVDPEIWHLLRLTASLDVKSGEEWLHGDSAIREWIAGRG